MGLIPFEILQDNYEYAVEEALEAAAAAANADAGDNDADDDALPSYQQFEKYVVNAPGNSPLKFYACNQCKRTFSHIKSLKRHSMTHIGLFKSIPIALHGLISSIRPFESNQSSIFLSFQMRNCLHATSVIWHSIDQNN